MEFQEFINQVIEQLPDYLLVYDIEKICVEKVKKNNGVICTGVVICVQGDSVSPNIYMEYYYSLYKQGRTMEDILKLIVKEYSDSRKRIADEEFNIDTSGIRDRIFLRLVNYEKNKDLLENCPFVPFQDMALTYRYLVKQNSEGIASAIITYDELKRIGVLESELEELALKNTRELFPPRLDLLSAVMYDLTGRELPEDLPLYILTNKQCINGATSMVYDDILTEAGRVIGNDFFILPSSVHEVLLLSVECGSDEEYLISLVREINSTVLQEMDFLSDNIYRYDTKYNRICILEVDDIE